MFKNKCKIQSSSCIVSAEQAVISDQNNRGPKISSSTLVSIHRRNAPEEYDYVIMNWEKFNDRVPKDAVRIRDEDEMYVCRNTEKKCVVGILKESKCEYEKGEEGKLDHPDSFEVLVNKDDFESLEWKRVTCTQEVEEVRENAVKICDDQNLFVGRKSEEAKSLPAEKSAKRKQLEKIFSIKKTKDMKKLESKTGLCKVLTVSYENVKEQKISDFQYEEEKKKETNMGIQIQETIVVTNKNSVEATQTVQPTKSTSKEERWDLTYSITKGVKLTIGGDYKGFKAAFELSYQSTTTEHTGNAFKKDRGFISSSQVKVPPKSKCTVHVKSSQLMAEIPFKTKLTRYYKRGEPKIKEVSGTFVSSNFGHTEFVIEKCEPLDGNVASAGRADPRQVTIVRDQQQQIRQGRSL